MFRSTLRRMIALQFVLHAEEVQSRRVAHLEFDEYVDIAVGSEIIAQDRAEQAESLHVVPTTELRDLVAIDGDCWLGSARTPARPESNDVCLIVATI